MDSIEEYLQEEYIVEKNRIKEIDELMNEVFKTFCLYKEVENYPTDNGTPSPITGWPYEIIDEKIEMDNFSTSTNSMMLFVMSKFLDKIEFNSPIIPCINWEIDWKFIKKTKEQEPNIIKGKEAKITEQFYKDIYSKICDSLIAKCILKKDYEQMFYSGSFGSNDPFTLSWTAELIVNDKDRFDEIKDRFIKVCIERIKIAFKNPEDNILEFIEKKEITTPDDASKAKKVDKPKRESSNHIFPLLRLIHLYKTLSEQLIEIKDFSKYGIDEIKDLIYTKLFYNLQNRINQQISYSVLQNSLFDTAELIMSLEGLILIDDKKKVDEALLTKAFEILKTNQKNNLNWRPLKPFVTSPQGDILLPLSIEIANSLLRICKHLEKKRKYYFHEFFDIFENYTKWLLSNVSQCKIGDTDYRGWRSEHVQKHNVIHPWETAQVVIYLMNYKSMIQDRIAYKSLKKSGLSCEAKYVKEEKSDSVEFWDGEWDVNVKFGFPNCYEEIRDNFIKARKKNVDPLFSMLLYGPPGTGKSSIAEKLAEALNWRLITITPSDFIKYGEADIEGRAKSIFKTLEEQKDCVILFDEIDRLILDRDSNYYSNQGDFYQFMTPSMLVKIKDLRTKERSIFIVATNYEERIDSAIKRSGRIDEKYLVNTLNLEQRIEKIKGFLGDKKLSEGSLELIAKKTYLYTFTELKTLVKSKCKNLKKEDDIVKTLLKAIENEEPTIKLLNYKRRFQLEKEIIDEELKYVESSIFPYKEFLALLYLKLESNVTLDDEEVRLVKRVNGLPGFKLEKHFEKESGIYLKIVEHYPELKTKENDSIKSDFAE